jgi:hypothetical protein
MIEEFVMIFFILTRLKFPLKSNSVQDGQKDSMDWSKHTWFYIIVRLGLFLWV